MFCGKCGKANTDGSKFCSGCGAPLSQPAENAPPVKPAGNVPPMANVQQPTGSGQKQGRFVSFLKRRWMIIAPVAVVIIVILCFLNSIITAIAPSYAVLKASGKTFTMLDKRLDSSPLSVVGALADCGKDGTIKTTFSYDDNYGTNVSGDVSLLSNSQKNHELITNLKLNGIDLDLTALFNKDRAAFSSSLVDDQYYGITYKTFDDDIKKFAEDASLDDATVEAITNVVDSLRSASTDQKALFMKYGELLKDFYQKLKPAVSSEQITVGGDNMNCKKITYVVTEDDLYKLFKDFYTMLSKDKDMRDYLMSYLEAQNSFGSGYYSGSGESADTLYDNMMDQLSSAIDSFKDEYSGKLNIIYYISGNTLVRFEFSGSVKISGDKASFDLTSDFGKRPDVNDIEVSLSMKDDSGTDTKLKATLQSELKSGVQTDQLKLKATYYGNSDSILLKSEWTKKSGDLQLSLNDGSGDYTMDGNLKFAGGGFKLSLDVLDDTLNAGSLNIEIDAQKGANIPNPSYVNLDKWGTDLVDKLQEAMGNLTGINYGDSGNFYGSGDSDSLFYNG